MSGLEQTTPDGYQQTEVGIIPTEWTLDKLDKLTDLIIDGTHHTPKYTKFGVPFLRVTDINGVLDESEFKYVSTEEHAVLIKRAKPEFGDLLLSKNGTIGIPKVVNWSWEFSIFVSLALIKPKKKLLNSNYLEQFFKSNFLTKQLEQKAKQGAVTNLHLEEIREILLPMPPLVEEQTAIANALSDVDALLSELDKLIAKKQAIKTATMQQLLTGKTRLPQFATYTDGDKQGQVKGTKPSELGEIPEDWDVSTIDNISLLPMQNGLFYEPVRKGKGIPLINVSDMYTSAPIDVDSLELFDATEPEIKTFNVIEGDLFFTRSSIVPSGIAYCNVYPLASRVAVFDSHLIKVRVNPSIADYRFIYLNCLAAHARAHLVANAKTATMTTIDQKAIKSCPVLLPSIQEQTAIATILSDIDEEIQALKQRLSKTRQIKQGMMQELLTGKTRLPFDKVDTKL
ncbi:restriction endonuclease subunit S [Vibrio cyclitrophicus]